MSIRTSAICMSVALVFLNPASIRAQYLYMDANGNGIHDAGDRVRKNQPTMVDIYLASDRNRDGSVASCDGDEGTTHTAMQVLSYGLAFKPVGGTVSYQSFTNAVPSFQHLFSLLSGDEYFIFYGAGYQAPWLEPGLHYLGRLQIVVTSGAPSLEFEPNFVAENYSDVTAFGTPCPGLDFDNTYKLGSDFHDADGLAAPGGPPASPGARVVVSPNPMNPAATFSFETSRPGRVRVQMFDVSGRLVRTLADAPVMPAGPHQLFLDGKSDRGIGLASGVYLYRLECADGISTGRVTINR